jgi:hypothetical protein
MSDGTVVNIICIICLFVLLIVTEIGDFKKKK